MEMEWAKEFLLERLEDGPVKSNDVLDEARQKGIAEKILKQAKKDLGVKSRKEQGTADGAWFWELPTKAIKRSPPPKNGPGGADAPAAPKGADAPPVAPVAVSPNGTERGLSDLRIRQLAEWYAEASYRDYSPAAIAAGVLDAELRAILRREVGPEGAEVEFVRVTKWCARG
jgi:hypothetical protein